MVLETKIWVLGVLTVVIASRPSQWTELDNICVYTNRPGFKFHVNFLLAVGFLVSYFLSVGNSICKMGMVIFTFQGSCKDPNN